MEHELTLLRSHGDAVVATCACGWVSAPCRMSYAEAAFDGHLRRAVERVRRLAA